MPVPAGEVVRLNLDEEEKEEEKADGEGEGEKANGSTAPEGMRLEVKRLDEVYDRNRSEWTKRDTVPRKSKNKDEAHAEFAFSVIRKFNPTQDPTLHLITTTYDIRSPHLRKMGKDIIGQVQGISWTSKPLKVTGLAIDHSSVLFIINNHVTPFRLTLKYSSPFFRSSKIT